MDGELRKTRKKSVTDLIKQFESLGNGSPLLVVEWFAFVGGCCWWWLVVVGGWCWLFVVLGLCWCWLLVCFY